MSLQSKLITIQSELKAPKNQVVRKKNKNDQWVEMYRYRSLEDILEAVKPLLKKHRVNMIITDQLIDVAGLPFINATAKLFDEESEVIIESSALAAMDIAPRQMAIGQATGAASSYARKYALNALFLIDDTRDPDQQAGDDSRLEESKQPVVKRVAKPTQKKNDTFKLDSLLK